MLACKLHEGGSSVILELRFGLLFDEGIQPIGVGSQLLGGRRRIRGTQRREIDSEYLA